MAKQVITKLLDDMDGGEADETVSFAFDGSAYEIDLSAKNAARFRELMAPFQQAGNRIGRSGSPAQLTSYRKAGAGASASRTSREENQKVREWAANNGYDLAERGRIPGHIQEAYDRNTPNPAWVASQNAKKLEEEQAAVAKPRKRASSRAAAASFSA